jgi:hypothetical protein
MRYRSERQTAESHIAEDGDHAIVKIGLILR